MTDDSTGTVDVSRGRKNTVASERREEPGDGLSKPNPVRRITPEERRRMVAEAAYFRAEKRGFEAGDPAEDWAEAEVEIGALIAVNNWSIEE